MTLTPQTYTEHPGLCAGVFLFVNGQENAAARGTLGQRQLNRTLQPFTFS